MRFAARCFVFGLLVSMYFAGTASAQYMKITTDNPTDNTRMRATGTTILTITLDTNHDKNGTVQSCNSHTSANCGSVTTAQPLDMFSYTIALKAVGGTVTWGTFSGSDANYTDTSPQIQSDTEVEINKSRPTGTFTPPGLATLGTIAATAATGSPAIQVQIGASIINPFGFGTAFGTECDGFFFPNTYVVGNPTDPCGAISGIAGDWFDWDGALSSSGNTPPTVSAPPTAIATENVAMTPITATATDPDAGATITFSQTGMPADLTFSTTPGASPITATVSGTPGFSDAPGPYNINWIATDNASGVGTAVTALTIVNTDRPPQLTQPTNMTVNEGSSANQALDATDPDGDAILFSKLAGPNYVTVQNNPGNILLAPGFTDAGTATATVRATANGLTDDKSLTITVNNVNRAPTLNQPLNMTVAEGATADQVLSGTDPDGDALTFVRTAGPTFATTSSLTPVTGSIHLAPPSGTAGTYTVTLVGNDGATNSPPRNLTVTVIVGTNIPPVLAQPSNMTVAEGATASQALSATDADLNPLQFTKTNGPTFATVTTVNAGNGTATGSIALAPGFNDAGVYTVTVTASDGLASDARSFTIIVLNTNRAPALGVITDMTVIEFHTADQAISGTDADGDALSFSKTTGPAFMSVTTTSPGTGTGTGTIHLAPGSGTASTTAYSASVTATDGAGFTTRPFSITVNPNQTPVLAQPANMTVDENSTANQALGATDADGDAVTFSLTSGPTYASVTTTTPGTGTGTGNLHLAPGFDDAGTAGATVQASDGFAVATRSLTITVNNVNRAPVLTQPGNISVNEATTADRSLVANDADGDALTYSLVSGPTYATVTTASGTGNLHVAPGYDDAGTATATVQASDGIANDQKSLTIEVNNVNRPPTMNPLSPMTVNEGGTADQALSASDPDGDAVRFERSSGPSWVIVTTSGSGVGNVHLQPSFSDAGTASATISAVDPSNASANSGLFISVNNVDRPVLMAGMGNMALAAGSTADQSFTAADPDEDAITFTHTGPTFMTRTDNPQVGTTRTGSVHLAPSSTTFGTFAASVTATANGTTSTQNFEINVTAVNNPPTLAQPNNMTVNEGQTADQAITATDPDGNGLSFSLASGPTYANVTTTDGGSGTATGNVHLAPGLSDIGTASATVRATDGSLNSDKSFQITVNTINQAPVLAQPTDMTVVEGNISEQTLSGTDADGDALQFQKVTGPSFMTVALTSGVVHLAPVSGDAGTHSASVSVTDGIASDTKSFTIFVIAASLNRAPVLDQPAAMTAQEGSTADQSLHASDSDGNPLTFALVSGPTYAHVTTTDGGSGTATGLVHLAPGFSDAGTAIASVSASDGFLIDGKSFQITVENTNRAPALDALSNMTVAEGDTLNQTAHATDPDGDALTYHKDSGPSFMTVQLDGLIHLAPHSGDAGTYDASVSASDGTASDSKSFLITVTLAAANHPPVLAQPSNMTVNEGETQDQTINATDPDDQSLTFSLVDGPTFASVTTLNATQGRIHLEPGFTASGTYAGTVRATDPGSLFDDKSFTITVNNVNRPPFFPTIGDQFVAEGDTKDFTVHATDPDLDPVTISAQLPAFATLTPDPGTGIGSFHLAPGFGNAGAHPATVTATDDHGGAYSESFTIFVTLTNRKPLLAQPSDMTVNENATADQPLSATDADGQELTFSITGPTYATVTTTEHGTGTATGNLHLAPGFSDAGTAPATVTASDGSAEDSKSLTITVLNQDRAPVLDAIGNMAVAAGATADQSIHAADPDGDTMTELFEGPAFASLTTSQGGGILTGTIHLAPPLGTSGSFEASVTVSANGLSDSHTFSITVTEVNHPPVLAQPSDMRVDENATRDQALSATDADGNGITFSKITGPSFLVVTTVTSGTGTGTGNAHLAPGYSDAGTYAATVSASDGGLTDQKSFLITVNNVNQPPVADAGGPYTGIVGTPVNFTGSASDADGNSVTLSWDFDASNGITSEATGATASHTYLVNGTYTVTLTATDNGTPALTGVDTATATISSSALEAIISLTGNDRFIRLSSGRIWCVQIRAKNGMFRSGDVIGSSILASYNGLSIQATTQKEDDRERNIGSCHGRLRACFGKDDLRSLFASLPNGFTVVDVVITGNLRSGGSFRGVASVLVIKGGDLAHNDDGENHDNEDGAVSADPYASPNPFNPNTTIHYELSLPGSVRLHIYDVSGRLVKTLVNDVMGSGAHEVAWDGTSRSGSRVSSGVYFYVLQTPERIFKSQLVVTK